MRLRTFTAPTIPAAMEMVRETLGDNAIILSSGKHNGHTVSVTAAVNKESDQWPVISDQKNISPTTDHRSLSTDLRFEMQNVLRFHNLPEMFISRLMQKADEGDFTAAVALHKISGGRNARHLNRLAVEKLMAACFDFEPLAFDAPDTCIMLVGPPGAGKTLTIAKFAARMAMDKQALTVITTDNKRAGGIEQLKAFTDILHLELRVAASREELAAALNSAAPRILIDTAGCNPYEEEECKELTSYTTIGGIEPILVMPAGGDSLEAIDMVETFSAMPIRRILVTRADTARRFGSILAAGACGLAFSNASHSASIIDPLHPTDPTLLAELLLKYQS
jgi:flagellar biosynthesis protein FlhF